MHAVSFSLLTSCWRQQNQHIELCEGTPWAAWCVSCMMCELHDVWAAWCVSCMMCELHDVWAAWCVSCMMCELHDVWAAWCVSCMMCELHDVWAAWCVSCMMCELHDVWAAWCVSCMMCELHDVWAAGCAGILLCVSCFADKTGGGDGFVYIHQVIKHQCYYTMVECKIHKHIWCSNKDFCTYIVFVNFAKFTNTIYVQKSCLWILHSTTVRMHRCLITWFSHTNLQFSHFRNLTGLMKMCVALLENAL